MPQIPVVADLPVGENLQDHINLDTPTFTVPRHVSFTTDRVNSWLSTLKYELFGTGETGKVFVFCGLVEDANNCDHCLNAATCVKFSC